MEVSEIKRGAFVYRDTFFADVGGGRRHPRASVAELRSFLLPETGYPLFDDQVGHWYEAQLLHYGLARTKDKNAAKVRLMSAIVAGTLVVPAYIVQIEVDMKKEFAAKAAAKKAQEVSSWEGSSARGNKRKAELDNDTPATTSRTKVSVTVGDLSFDIDHYESGIHNSRKQVTPTKTTSRSLTASDATPRAKQTASKVTGAPVSAPSSARPTAGGRHPGAVSNPWASTLLPPIQRHETIGFHSDNYGHADSGDEPPPYDSLGFDRVGSTHQRETTVVRLQASGNYAICTPFQNSQCELSLVKDRQTGQFWASLLVADYEGVFNIPDATGMATRQTVEFYWRAEDLHSGDLRFRRDQTGWIQFDGQGGVSGCWNGLLWDRDLEFQGHCLG